MSYARPGEGSDVFVVGTHLNGNRTEGFICIACRFVPTKWVDEPDSILGGYIRSTNGEPTSYTAESRTDMIKHLARHREAGHKVPDRAFDRLAAEEEWGQP